MKQDIKKRLFKELEILGECNGIVYKCPTDLLEEEINNLSDETYSPRKKSRTYLDFAQKAPIETVIKELQNFKGATIGWDEDDIWVNHEPREETEEEIFHRIKVRLWNKLWGRVYSIYKPKH